MPVPGADSWLNTIYPSLLSGDVPNKMGGYPAYQVARNSSNSRDTRSCILYELNVSRPLSSVVSREIPLGECPFVVPIALQALTAFSRPSSGPDR